MKIRRKKLCVWIIGSVVLFIIVCLENSYRHENRLFRVANPWTLYSNISNYAHHGNNLSLTRTNKITKDESSPGEVFNVSKKIHVQSKCNGLEFPVWLQPDEIWNPVTEDKQTYIFSAYVNTELTDVTVIGATAEHSLQFNCQFWYTAGNNTVTEDESGATTMRLAEGHGLRYTAVLFRCQLPSKRVPTYISLSKDCRTPCNLLRLVPPPSTFERKFTVCLTPLNFNYSRDYELIEWIELNRILGAEKFFIYNYSSAANVVRVLKYYSERNLVDVVQWKLPMGVDTFPTKNPNVEIHYFGQVAVLQDCLYRNKYRSEFIVNIDLDEFIIPHSEKLKNWHELLKVLNNNSGVYLFRNVFFRKEWVGKSINGSLAEKFKLATLQTLLHEKTVFPARQRSKYIARTSDVSVLMIHEVPGILNGKTLETVPLEIGFLHHYRNWEEYGAPPRDSVLDTTVPDRYGNILINNVRKVWEELTGI